jgi:hypothetical protein
MGVEPPPDAYDIEALNETPCLSTAEEQGIEKALASLREGQGRSTEQVRQRIDLLMRK